MKLLEVLGTVKEYPVGEFYIPQRQHRS